MSVLPEVWRLAIGLCVAMNMAALLHAQPQVERLDRGVVAVHQPDGSVFVSWRLLADDPEGVGFNVYRRTEAGDGGREDWGIYASRQEADGGVEKLNETPLTGPTWWLDRDASLYRPTSYFVRAVVDA